MSVHLETTLRRAARGAAAVLVLTLAAVGGLWLPAAAQSRPETTHVDVGGVRIRSVNKDANVKVEVGPAGIEITDKDDPERPKRVDIRGPVIIVDDGDQGLVRVFADAEVGREERVEGDVVAVFGSVKVDGQVDGDVVAVFGSVILEPTAVVEGDVVAIGGALNHKSGAEVRGESVSLGILSWAPSMPALPMLLGMVFACWLVSMLFGSLLLLIAPDRMRRVGQTAVRRTGASLLLGIASAPMLVILIVLLLITVVGIPFAILLPLAYKLALWGGQLACAQVIGARLLRRPLDGLNPYASMAAGTLFVAAFFVLAAVLAGPQGLSRTAALFFTLLGLLFVVGLSAVGIGAVLLSRFGSGPRSIAEPELSGSNLGPSPSVPASPTVAG
jgi:hypothetical protein